MTYLPDCCREWVRVRESRSAQIRGLKPWRWAAGTSVWMIFVSSLTLSSHCSIAPLLYRTILSFIIAQMSIIVPPLSCKKQVSKQQRLWPGQKTFVFLKEGQIYGTMYHILCICSSLSFPLLRLNPHRNSHRLSHTFSLKGQQTGKCFDMTEEAVDKPFGRLLNTDPCQYRTGNCTGLKHVALTLLMFNRCHRVYYWGKCVIGKHTVNSVWFSAGFKRLA